MISDGFPNDQASSLGAEDRASEVHRIEAAAAAHPLPVTNMLEGFQNV